MAISLQRVIRSTSCLVLGWGFRGRRIERRYIYDSNKSKMAATAMLEKFQVAISPQPVVRSTSCFVLGWFLGTADLMALFSERTNPRWRPPPFEKISNGHISATGRTIHFMFGYRVGFSGTADDLMALFSIRINTRWRPPPSWII